MASYHDHFKRGDSDRDRNRDDRDHNRDDRDRDRNRDRDRSRHPPPPPPSTSAARAGTGHSTRETQESRASENKTGIWKADLIRLSCEMHRLGGERGRVAWNLETEKKLCQSKMQDYKSMAGTSQFPGQEMRVQNHMVGYKNTTKAIEKELDETDRQYTKALEDFAERVIQGVPLSEINQRQINEAVQKQLALQKPAPDSRIDKLEKQLESLAETQQSQTVELDKIKKENDALRAQNAAYKTQVDQITSLADALKKGQEQELATQENKWEELLEKEMFHLRVEINSLRESVESRKDEFQKSLDEVKSQNSHAVPAVPADAASKQELAALKERVDAHDEELSDFDAREHSGAMEKLVHYPPWEDLSARLASYEKPVRDLGNFDQRLKTFSDGVYGCVEQVVKDFEEKLKALEARAFPAGVVPPSPQLPPASRAIEQASLVELKKNVTDLQDETKTVRGEFAETRKAHELMIRVLDSQFKNMTTSEMAQTIFDNIKRLPQNTALLDVHNFHERLANLEKAQQEEVMARRNLPELEEKLNRTWMGIGNGRSNGSMASEQFVQRKPLESSGIENDAVEE